MRYYSSLQHSPRTKVILTDDHAASSYGEPILVIGGQAYGPGDVYRDAEVDVSFLYLGPAECDEMRALDAEVGGWFGAALDMGPAGMRYHDLSRAALAAVEAWNARVEASGAQQRDKIARPAP